MPVPTMATMDMAMVSMDIMDMDMVMDMDMDTVMARGLLMLSQLLLPSLRLLLMLTTVMDIVWDTVMPTDTPDMPSGLPTTDTTDTHMPTTDTTARGLLMLSPLLMLPMAMLMVMDTDMVMDLDMPTMDIMDTLMPTVDTTDIIIKLYFVKI